MNTTMNLCSVVAFLVVVAVSDGFQFRRDYIYHSLVDGWLKLHTMPVTWHEARLWCHYEGSVLASPLTYEMMTAMKAHIGRSNDIAPFTGISANYSEGVFFSIEGVPLDKIQVQWAPGQPDNVDGQEQCIAMLCNYDNYQLADVRCDKPRPFLCFKKNSKDMPSMTECGTIDPEYSLDRRTGHCYKLHRLGLTWPQAFKACTAEGGYLAIANSAEEVQVLTDLIAKHPENTYVARHTNWLGMGFRDLSGKGTVWTTIHGETLKEAGYDKWVPGTPSSAFKDELKNELCGIMDRVGLLDDIECYVTIPFICEMEPEAYDYVA